MWKVEIVRVYKSSNLLCEYEDKVIFEVNSLAGEMPVVMHRKNRKEWLVTMPLDDWMKLYEKMVEEVQNA